MSNYWKRALAVTSITAAATLGLTACGGDAAAPSTSTTEQKTEAPSSAKDQLTADDFAKRISAAQLEAGTVHNEMTTEASGQTTSMSGDLQLSDDPAKLKMSMTMSSPAAMEIRLVDSIMYMNMGELSQNKFVATDLNSPEATGYGDLLKQSDPQQQMEQLSKAIQDFQVSDETEEIDGVETYAYTLTIDSAALLEGQDIPADSLPETITYVMNVGTDDLPRRMVMDMGGTKTETNYSKWGEAISVEAPSADEIVAM